MKNINVAVFENNEDLLNELTNYISSVEGYEVCAASANGNVAADLIKRKNPDVAIVDLVLSGLDGFGVLDALKETCSGCLSIAIGGFADDKIVDRAIEHGAVYYLAKPVKAETLMNRIRELSSDRSI